MVQTIALVQQSTDQELMYRKAGTERPPCVLTSDKWTHSYLPDQKFWLYQWGINKTSLKYASKENPLFS